MSEILPHGLVGHEPTQLDPQTCSNIRRCSLHLDDASISFSKARTLQPLGSVWQI